MLGRRRLRPGPAAQAGGGRGPQGRLHRGCAHLPAALQPFFPFLVQSVRSAARAPRLPGFSAWATGDGQVPKGLGRWGRVSCGGIPGKPFGASCESWGQPGPLPAASALQSPVELDTRSWAQDPRKERASRSLPSLSQGRLPGVPRAGRLPQVGQARPDLTQGSSDHGSPVRFSRPGREWGHICVCPEGRALSAQPDRRGGGRGRASRGPRGRPGGAGRAEWLLLFPGLTASSQSLCPGDSSGGGHGASATLHPPGRGLEAQRGQNLPTAAR